MQKTQPFWVRISNMLMVACLAVMVVLVFGNVVLRYVFNSGISVSEEVSRLLFVWLTFIGAVAALWQKAHLGVDTLLRMVGPRARRSMVALSQLLMLACCALMLIGSWRQTMVNLVNFAPVSGLSQAWLYGVGILSALGLGAVTANELWGTLSGHTRDEELVMVSETEEHLPASADKTGER